MVTTTADERRSHAPRVRRRRKASTADRERAELFARVSPRTARIAPPIEAIPPVLRPVLLGSVTRPDPGTGVVLMALLTAISALSGPAVATAKLDGNSPILRLALVTSKRRLPLVLAPVQQALYTLQNVEIDRWREAEAADAPRRAMRTACSRAALQMATASLLLGAPSLGLPIVPPEPPRHPRPKLVIADACRRDILAAAATGSRALILLDGRRAPWMAGWGDHHDLTTADLINAAGDGAPIAVEDHLGHMRMERLSLAAIGTLTFGDLPWLHAADDAQLRCSTIVEADVVGTPAVDRSSLERLLTRIHALGHDCDQPKPIRFERATRRLTALDGSLPPLHAFAKGLPDLVERLAIALHLAVWAAGDESDLPDAVSVETTRAAVALARRYVLPNVRRLLGPVSMPLVVLDARRILSFAQQRTSEQHPVLHRRDLVRAWQRSMSPARIDAATELLCDRELLVPDDGGDRRKAGAVFSVASSVYAPRNRLPDLSTPTARSVK